MNYNLQKNKKLFALLFLIGFLFPMLSFGLQNEFNTELASNNQKEDSNGINKVDKQIENSASDTEYLSTSTIENREGKIFNKIQTSHSNCYINGKEPSLSNQPDIYIPGWNITHADMSFENIKALNYTRDIETDYSEFIYSSIHGPIYFYQKFSVRISQYVNNVSIFIQDINNPSLFTDENSWEVAIVNTTKDGIPNENEVLGSLKKPHPIIYAAHWNAFDFKNSDNGPIFLNNTNTNSTKNENGETIYWFAIRVKIPRDDSDNGGGPKFLYFNLDGGDSSNIGEGDTYTINPNFFSNNYTTDFVFRNQTVYGNHTEGDTDSFSEFDTNRYFVESINSSDPKYNLTWVDVKLNITELSGYGITFDDIAKRPGSISWWSEHYKYLNSINISMVLNVSGTEIFNYAYLQATNRTGGSEIFYPYPINQSNEEKIDIIISDAWDKYEVIRKFMNTTDNNSMSFQFILAAKKPFNLTINKFTVTTRQLPPHNTIIKNDPQILKTYYPNEVKSVNESYELYNGETALESVSQIDEKRYMVETSSDNASIEFKFNILQEIDQNLFEVNDIDTWLFQVPNPIIPRIDIRITSNVSVYNRESLNLSVLEIYKGNNNISYFTEEQNKSSWIRVGSRKNSYAFSEETTNVTVIDPIRTWTFMQLVNNSDNNSIRLRLRYIGNGTLKNFNISINEFAFLIYVQNAISSDIASKVGLGLNSNTLNPSDIEMKNFGSDLDNNGYQKGDWEGNIKNGILNQGTFEFNISSIWPYITFDVSLGTYTIEQIFSLNWEYEVSESNERALWYVGADLTYFDGYSVLDDSKGMEAIVPSEWKSMEVYNFTDPPPYNSSKNGDWYWTNSSSGDTQTIKVYNIGEGLWKIKLNSSKSQISVSYDTSDRVKINKTITNNALIHNDYGGTFEFEVYNNETKLVYSASSNLNGTNLENSTSFQWNIFDTTKKPGTYYMKTSWVTSNSTHAFVASETTSIEIEQFNINLELLNLERYRNNSIYGTEILIGAKATVNETGDSITGEKINIEIYDENDDLIEELSDITNENGRIEISYLLPEGYQSIKIKLTYTTEGTYFTSTESKQSININLISQGQSIVNTFITLSPYIIIGIAAVSTYVVLRQRRLNKLRAIWAKDAQILDDLLRISHIMIIHKEAGVVIYDKKVAIEEIDSDLIGGFLQAISSFRQEIRKDIDIDKGTKGFEMDYYDFKIVITDGEYIRIALILDGTPSESLKERQVEFTKAFESKFGKVLQEFDGEIKAYRAADKLIEDHFYISLAYPLKLSEHWEIIDLEPLEKDLVEVAQQIEAEKSFFFVSNLLSYGLAGRSESRNQIISAIISLSDKEVLEPIKMEA